VGGRDEREEAAAAEGKLVQLVPGVCPHGKWQMELERQVKERKEPEGDERSRRGEYGCRRPSVLLMDLSHPGARTD
jgi:hypothetical protein